MFKRFWWVLLVMAVAAPTLGLLISATITYVMPKKFESTGTIPCRAKVMKDLTPEDSRSQTLHDHIQLMKSDDVLLKVARDLDLFEKWGLGKAQLLEKMKASVAVEQNVGVDLITVRVSHTNKEDARDITSEVLRSHRVELSEKDRVESKTSPSLIVLQDPVIYTALVSPNFSMNLLIGVFGGLFLSPFLSLPLIWLLNLFVKKPSEAPSPA